MASIHTEITLDAPAELVWDAVRDVGNVHRRLVPGVLTGTTMEDGARIVTFANGLVVRELIVDVDETARRLVWAAVGGRLAHHNASLQVFPTGAHRCRLVWIADLLPDAMAGDIRTLIGMGAAAIRRTFAAPVHREARS
ncbi:MAG: SRPBCC family protein [Deltaproteobacteria bacterium]|nr:SRPBCC family protein [Deltaproteobacteria bacterium]